MTPSGERGKPSVSFFATESIFMQLSTNGHAKLNRGDEAIQYDDVYASGLLRCGGVLPGISLPGLGRKPGKHLCAILS
jgi:hypothetical protein